MDKLRGLLPFRGKTFDKIKGGKPSVPAGDPSLYETDVRGVKPSNRYLVGYDFPKNPKEPANHPALEVPFNAGNDAFLSEMSRKTAYDACTPFAKGFFLKCDELGVPIHLGVEKVGSDYGEEARQELLDGMEKVSAWYSKPLEKGVGFGKGLLGFGKAPLPKGGPMGAAPPMPMPKAPPVQNLFHGAEPMMQPGMAAGHALNPYLGYAGRQAGGSAGGALVGGMSGNDLGMFGEDHSGPLGMNMNAAAAGAAAFNPFLRRQLGSRMGGVGSVPLASLRTGFMGSMAGSGIDQTIGAAGFNQQPVIGPDGQPMMDPHTGKPMTQTRNTFGSLGGKLGMGYGAARQGLGVGTAAMGANAPQWMRTGVTGMAQGERQLGNFAYGQMDPMIGLGKAMIRKPIQLASGGKFSGGEGLQAGRTFNAWGGLGASKPVQQSVGRTAGRLVGAGGLAAGGLGMAYNHAQQGVSDMVDQNVGRVYNEAMPQMKQDLTDTMDQYMGQRGMLDEHGQFDPSSRMMKGLSSGSDNIFRSMGMDPSRMSGLQKVMILGGAVGGGGGLLAGSPALAGMGGLSAAAGLLPMMMPGQGQQRQQQFIGQPGVQGGYNPGSMGGPAAQAGQQGFNARNEWLHQQPQE